MKQEKEYLCSCLSDCGFSDEDREKYLLCSQEDKKASCLCLLSIQRKKLIDELHCIHRRIDIVDYMIRSVESEF